jgi:TadE-like protein
MVTVELAACLPVLVLLLAVALSAIGVASARVRAEDVARESARAAARGDTTSVTRLAEDLAPGSAVQMGHLGPDVRAVVHLPVHLLVSWLPSIVVTAEAVAAPEPP